MAGFTLKLTMAVWVVILVPREAPTMRRMFPVFWSTMMVGEVEERGILPETMRLCHCQEALLVPDVSLLRSLVIPKQFCLNKMRPFSFGISTAI